MLKNEFPLRKTTSKIFKQLQLKSNILKHDITSSVESEKIEEKCSLDRISNKMSKIKAVSYEMNNELSKQNALLDYTTNVVDNASDKMDYNTRKIHKILK